MADMDSKRSFKTVSHKDLLTINNNESVFFGSKMSQTKHKPLRTTVDQEQEKEPALFCINCPIQQ